MAAASGGARVARRGPVPDLRRTDPARLLQAPPPRRLSAGLSAAHRAITAEDSFIDLLIEFKSGADGAIDTFGARASPRAHRGLRIRGRLHGDRRGPDRTAGARRRDRGAPRSRRPPLRTHSRAPLSHLPREALDAKARDPRLNGSLAHVRGSTGSAEGARCRSEERSDGDVGGRGGAARVCRSGARERPASSG